MNERDIGEAVRERLEIVFPDNIFSEKFLQVGLRVDDIPAIFKFDGVSDDCDIVALIDRSRADAAAGFDTRRHCGQTFRAVYLLSLLPVPKKLLVFVDRARSGAFPGPATVSCRLI